MEGETLAYIYVSHIQLFTLRFLQFFLKKDKKCYIFKYLETVWPRHFMAVLPMVVEVSYHQFLAVIVVLGALCMHRTEIIEKELFPSQRDKNPGLSFKFILAVSNNSK